MAPQVTGIKLALMGSSESEELSGCQKGPQFPVLSKCTLNVQDKAHCWENESKHSMAPEIGNLFWEPDKDHTCSSFPCNDPNCPYKGRDGEA